MKAAKTPSPRLRNPPRLTGAAKAVLAALVAGAYVRAIRTFPHPHLYRVHRSEEPVDVTEEEISLLLANRCIVARPKDHPVCDEIEYHASETGFKVHAAGGKITKPEPGQLNLLDGL